jgi:hypothetical protein
VSDATVERLADAIVYDPDGNEVRLGSFWDERAVILAMIRHFG